MATSDKVTVDRRVYLDGDGRAVEHGDPSAVVLWAAAGRIVSAADADAVGYVPGGPAPVEAKPAAGEVACPVDGCDYTGTKRGLKIHTGQTHKDT